MPTITVGQDIKNQQFHRLFCMNLKCAFWFWGSEGITSIQKQATLKIFDDLMWCLVTIMVLLWADLSSMESYHISKLFATWKLFLKGKWSEGSRKWRSRWCRGWADKRCAYIELSFCVCGWWGTRWMSCWLITNGGWMGYECIIYWLMANRWMVQSALIHVLQNNNSQDITSALYISARETRFFIYNQGTIHGKFFVISISLSRVYVASDRHRFPHYLMFLTFYSLDWLCNWNSIITYDHNWCFIYDIISSSRVV